MVTPGCPSALSGQKVLSNGTLACRTQASRRNTGSSSALSRTRQPYNELSEFSPAAKGEQLQGWEATPSATPLPKLQPISRTLARELLREQRLKKRLKQQIGLLQRQLVQHGDSQTALASNNPGSAVSSSSSSSSGVQLYEQWSEDPLFSAATPPSLEQLQRKLVHVQRQLLQASSESLADILTVTTRLQDMATCLELPLDLVVPMVARHEPLLLQPLQQLPPRLSFLSSALQLPPRNAAELLASSSPQLLATPLQKLQSNLTQLQRVLGSRGLDAVELLQERPDLLAQSPASIEAKLERLPGALSMSRQHVRQLVAECPQLLRRSVSTLAQRYRALCALFAIPDSFVEEFVLQEPQLLCLSAPTLKAKFDSLLVRYGAFSDDVVDMVNMQGLADLLSLDLHAGLMPLLWQQPGLLQLAPELAEYRLQHLAGLLQLSVPKTLGLVLQEPRLLVERPVLLAARLGSLCTLLSVQRGVASECVLREPLLLCVDDDELQQGWLQLCGRVGGWAPDAVDVVLADPAALLRGSF
ncbi:hypothetical protein OEZ86_013539 [Tetradesmus obliquus]|nr:hypothetical protein OEZ86_013539 [Tetradesmus obliquus]